MKRLAGGITIKGFSVSLPEIKCAQGFVAEFYVWSVSQVLETR